MTLWLELARLASGLNVVLVAGLGYVWWQGYRDHGAAHTLGLLVFAAFLLVENAVWLYLYVLNTGYIGWFGNADPTVQVSVTMLCGLELVALAVLTKITWL